MAFKKKSSGGNHSGGAEEKKKNKSPGEIIPEKENTPSPSPRERRAAEKLAREEAKAAKAAEKAAAKAEKEAYKNSPEAKQRRFKLKLALLIVALIIVLILFAVTFAAYRVSTSERNLPNIYVGEVFVGGMDREETIQALKDAGWEDEAAYALRVKLPASVSFKLDPVKAGAVLSLDYAATCAHHYGHSENWYVNLYRYVRNYVFPVDVEELFRSLNEDYIRREIDKGVGKFEKATSDTNYVVDREKNELSFMKGAGKMQINKETLYQEVCTALLAGETLVDHRHIDNLLDMPDFQAVYNTLAVEPQDAHYTEKFEVVDEVIGCTFDVKEAERLWQEAEPAQRVRVPMTITVPEIDAEELRSRLFRDKLGSQTTLYTYSNSNRRSNIALAASKLNGLILYPGDVFSFNGTVGQRTTEAGFLEAGAYADGQVVQEIGGGICQVSSTLYCATMYAQMETVSRTNHYFRIDYLPISYDAAVSWPNPDFKFKNCRDYPVKIVAYTDEAARSLTIEIWGTDVDGSYVELSYWYSEVYDEEYTDVMIGEAAICSRHVYDANGNRIATIQEPYSVYYLHEEDILWPEEEDDWISDILPDSGGTDDSHNNSGDTGYGNPAIIIPIS